MKKKILLCVIPAILSLVGCGGNPTEVADSVIYGNIVTMDENDTIAKAIAVKDKTILKIGSKEEIAKYVGAKTVEYDYGDDNYVYPGFLDSHTHTYFAGSRAIGQANLTEVIPTDKNKYKEIIREFIQKNPTKDKYLANGWVEGNGDEITREVLDDIYSEKPLALNTSSGHSILLNSKAMEAFGVNKDLVAKWGSELVHVDGDGDPTGYLCENPAIEILNQFESTLDEAKDYVMYFQDFAFQNGFTGVSDAGTELNSQNALQAHVDLQTEGKLKLRTYSYMMVKDNVDDPTERIEEIVNFANENNGEYFKVVGAKVFLDGVTEAHTAWLTTDYLDDPGYHGLERFNNEGKMVELIAEAGKNNLAVHSHSIGDGATRFFMSCVEQAQAISKNYDQRNAASHLQFVRADDIQKFANTNTIAVVPPLWSAKTEANNKEIEYVGEEKFSTGYPIKAFQDVGVKTAFHSDYPVSPLFNIPLSIYMANKRCIPGNIIPGVGGDSTINNPGQAISRKDAVISMTKNVAYMWHQEDKLGTLEEGKIANMSVFDFDLINGDIDILPLASVVATLVDGKEVYHAESTTIQDITDALKILILSIIYTSKYDWDDNPYWAELLLG